MCSPWTFSTSGSMQVQIIRRPLLVPVAHSSGMSYSGA